jgi:hypothetical protein
LAIAAVLLRLVFYHKQRAKANPMSKAFHLDRARPQRTSPWYNQFRSAIELPPLSPQEARTLITRPAEGSYEYYEDEAIERILTLSQRKPFALQLICHECVKRLWQEQSGAIITLGDVDAVWFLVQL